MLDGYNREELIHIVDMYNLNIDMDTLKKSKKEIMKEDMKQLTKSYYEALKRIKALSEEVHQLKNEVESLKGDKIELQSIKGH